jgi:hypothetical protein
MLGQAVLSVGIIILGFTGLLLIAIGILKLILFILEKI